MERSLAGVWTCLLGAGFALAFSATTPYKAFSRPPRLIGCVFVERRNVTCRWEPGDPAATSYTLQVKQNTTGVRFTCTTPDTDCTIGLNYSSVRFNFCVTVTAHGGGQNISSPRRCQSGRKEVMLPPVLVKSVKAKRGSPSCLEVTWSRALTEFPVAESEFHHLNSQIQFTAEGQLDAQVRNVTVTDYSFDVCLFRPDTLYTIRLRHRYQGPASPWSPWSRPHKGWTAEDAPSAAPVFWRQVKETSRNGHRLVSLLWKPLSHSLANGRVVFYNVTCRIGNTRALADHGSCRDLHNESTSCSLTLPPERCSCSLTASTSAGASPEARVWLPAASETEPPPPSQITARPLDDSSLEVRWAAPVNRSVSSFVVEWFAVREKSASGVLHWEQLNSSRTTLVITEGVRPMERYAVSVRAMYDQRVSGANRSLQIYTRQGTPSAGPNVTVQHISSGSVELGWSPVPVELLGGFIRNYTLYYTSNNNNNNTESVFVPGNVHHYTLENLPPGNYKIFMRANTDAGSGKAGAAANMHIGSEETWTVLYVVLPIILTSMALGLMVCLVQIKMVKQRLFKHLPDPSHSSLSNWTPKTTMECGKQLMVPEKPEIKLSEVVLLSELQDQDHGYRNAYSCQNYAPLLPVRMPEKMPLSPSVPDPTPPHIIYTQALQTLPPPVVQLAYRQLSAVNDFNPPLDGASKPPAPYVPPAADTTQLPQFLKQHQSPVSIPGIGSIDHSPVSPSHQAGVSLPKHPFSQSVLSSVRLGDSSVTPSFSPLPPSLFVDFAYCSVDCGPYISYDV